jgi:hypothetical protein
MMELGLAPILGATVVQQDKPHLRSPANPADGNQDNPVNVMDVQVGYQKNIAKM